LEIQDLLTDYCMAIDGRNWDALDEIFTDDAIIDYTEAGGAKGDLLSTKAYLDKALSKFPTYQHLIGLPQIKLDGDQATARTILFNPMKVEMDGRSQVFFVGLWYCDDLVRTEQGWRISHRREELSYFHNLPEGFAPE